MKPSYPVNALRSLALQTQQLVTPQQEQTKPDRAIIHDLVEKLGCIQIDTLQMVQRSQYLVVWSRLGTYDPIELDALLFGSNRLLFEGWQHAASIIPMAEYRYQMPRQKSYRDKAKDWDPGELDDDLNPDLMLHVQERIKKEGGLKGSDFAYNGPRRGSWWDWKPSKTALEYQLAYGNLMISDRHNFQRVYDLTERVLPDWVDTREPSLEERDRFWLERSVRALGVCNAAQAADYTWMKLRRARSLLPEMIKDGSLIEIHAELMHGTSELMLVHRDNYPLLEKAASGEIHAGRTTFLSPFDSLFWARLRDQKLWGFKKSLEAYLPAAKRTYGYFCLPMLDQDRLVGRFDPKLDRKKKHLQIKALYLEPGIELEEEMINRLATCMQDFLKFHQAIDLSIEKSQPVEFGKKLMSAIDI